MKAYDHKKIEKKWQTYWEKKKVYQAKDASKTKKPKYYSLIEFPYPSGDGLHVGHPRPYIGMDVISRKKRMEGYNVLYPIGWDAFGLPTENYAIKTGKDPRIVTKQNTDNYRRQIKSLGISFDWSREVNTTDPKYYKWTQWIFLQFLKKGLAYKAKIPINWCPQDKIGLANEEVVNGCCERCGAVVEKREKEQWMLAITKYAERLDKDLDTVDFLPHIKLAQKNWIGRSEGAEIEFKVGEHRVKVFTTRPDTLYGATYLVLAPDHELINKLKLKISNWKDVALYILETKMKDEMARTKEDKEKTGVELKGVKAINPATNEEMPIWIADYVLANYGTGAIMAVPAHDERDFAFAKKYNLPMKQVIMPDVTDSNNPPREGKQDTTRNTVHFILRNKKGEVLIQFLKGEKWKGIDPKSFPVGGIEEGESTREAGEREIKEETGYSNFKFVTEIPFHVQSRFFAAHKDLNRTIKVNFLVFDLINEEKTDITEDEYFTKDSHEMKWVPASEVAKTLSSEDQQMIWKYYQTGGFPYEGEGVLINSGRFDVLESKEAKAKITRFAGGEVVTKFKLRDWVFSRQRYWGEPIPVVHCPKCGIVPVPDKDLPVELPKVKNYLPTDSGESPLAQISKWVNIKCPKCKGNAKRETDTMPNWAGSSWYYLRYADPVNSKTFADKKKLGYWLGSDPATGGVNWYNGGNEHTTLHLLYSRFWHKFLYDLKLVPTSEPYKKRTSHGLILAEGGEKMSKSRGNVINPDDIVARFGADTMRVYEMFMGPFDQAIAWSEDGVVGPRRFLERVWNAQSKLTQEKSYNESKIQKLIKKVSEDIESMKFNTAISSLMIFLNEHDTIPKDAFEKFLKLLAPFAPHIAEELWDALGNKKPINLESWPTYDPLKVKEAEVKIVVQVNGKVRGEVMVGAGEGEEEVKNKALADESVRRHLGGNTPKKVIFVPGRLINIVV